MIENACALCDRECEYLEDAGECPAVAAAVDPAEVQQMISYSGII